MHLGFYELPEEEQPDELIWNHQERLDEWFKQVKEDRKHPNKKKAHDEEWEDVDLDQNEHTAELKKNLRK